MLKTKIDCIFSDKLYLLRVLMMGYHHDHCSNLYFGLTKDVPEHLTKHVFGKSKYISIYEEDIPIKNEKKKR